MKKLYYATTDVVFVHNNATPTTANSFFKEQLECYDPPSTEITCINQIPEDWRDLFIFGMVDITARQFLEQQKLDNNPEYQEYLRLKSKFE